MKDFADFLFLVESPEGNEAALEGVPELLDPRRISSGGLVDREKLALALLEASQRNTLNLLRMYHQWNQREVP